MATLNLTYEPSGGNLDLTVHDSGDSSPPEDFFTFFFKIVASFNIKLDVFMYSGNDNRNYAFYTLRTESKGTPSSVRGLASILEVKNAQGEILAREDFVSESDRDNTLDTIAQKTWIERTDEVQFATIPKKLFYTSSGFVFSDIHRLSFIFQNVSTGDQFCIGDVLLVGGGKDDGGGGDDDNSRGGMQGSYRYRVTFRNTTTGNRSNPGPVTQIARNVNRGYVALSGLPLSADPQVDAREIWRTMGDGTRFFKIDQIDDNTTETYDDQVADYAGLDSDEGKKIMSTDELPLDNNVPFSTHDHHIIDKLTAFWISADSEKSGRVYYSPIGRPESQKGFFDVGSAGDPLRRLVIFQGVRYVFSEAKLYRLSGDEPYVSFEINGVPGVSFVSRRTVAATPYGICWQAQDGLRLYNGANSVLLNFDPVGKIFRGESAENISAFEGIVATFARGEYIISDGTQCLAIEIQTGAWRHVGFNDITALFYEWDDDVLQGARTSQVELLEEEGTVDDDGAAIDISWETATGAMDNENVIFIERVWIDIDTNGETITPIVIHQYDSDTLATISNSSRSSFEREIQELLIRPGMRLTGSVNNRVTLYDIQFEYRQVVLGINIEGADRAVVPGRWREDLGANGTIVFEVESTVKLVDQTDQLYVFDRLTVEADTEGVTVTPTVTLFDNAITLAALSTTATRLVNTYQMDRIGPLNQVHLTGPFFTSGTRPKIYRVEAHVRELKMGITETVSGRRGEVVGRAPAPDTAIIFEVQPMEQMFNNLGSLYWIERLVLETDTNSSTITPTIKIGSGTLTLSTVTTTARSYTEIDVERVGPIENVTLSDDFTDDVQIFGVELFVRPIKLGIRMPDGQRHEVDGKSINSGTSIVFDIDPSDRRFDAQSYVPLIERLWIDVNSDGVDITPTILTENQTIQLSDVSSSIRDTVVSNINYVGRIRTVTLAADFVTNAIELYGVEIQMRELPLGVSIISNS